MSFVDPPHKSNQDADSTFNQQKQFVSGSQTNIAGTADGSLILAGDYHQITLSSAHNPTFHRLDNDFRNDQRHRAPATFYDGARPNWANIAQGHDAKRRLYQRLRTFVEDQHLPAQRMGLILGLAGEGKTTLLMRLAWDLAEAGWPVLWRHSGKTFRTAQPNFQRTYERPLVLCFDQADDETDLPTLAAELTEYGMSFVILATARHHEWRSAEMQTKLSRCLRLQLFDLERLTEEEISSLLDLLAANNQLGSLQSLSRSEQINHFVNRLQSDRQLLPALLVARRGAESFAAVIEDVLHNLRKRPDGELLYNAHITISAVHRFGLGLPCTVLSSILSIDPRSLNQRVLRPLTGELTEIDEFDLDRLYTRHPLLAEYVVRSSVSNNWCDLSLVYQNIFKGLGIMLRHRPFESSLRSLLTSLARQLKFAEPRLIPTLLKNMVVHPVLPGDASADAALYETWGVIGRSIGEYDKARQLFTEAARLDENRPSLWQAWGVLEARLANFARARELFQKAINIDPIHVPSWQAWGLLEQKQGNFDRARALFQRGTEVAPTDATLLQAWAVLEQRQNNITRARQLFQQGTEADPINIYIWQSWGSLERRRGNNDKARELFQQGIKADPTHASLWQAWGLLEEKQSNFDKARALFQQGTEADPTDPYGWQAWGLLEQKQGNIDRARALFQRGTEADPTDAALWQAWGLLEEKQGNFDRARALFQQGTEAAPASTHCWQAWARLEQEQSNIDRARELLQQGIESSPTDPALWRTLVRIGLHQGNTEKIWELFQRGIAADPTNAQLWHAMAQLEERQDNIGKARELFQQGIVADPTDAPLWQAWAILEKRQRNIDKARELFQQGIAADPTDAPLWQAWACLEQEQDNIVKARELFQQGVAADSTHAPVWQAWAILEQQDDNIDKARELFQQAIAVDPTHIPSLQAWALLEQQQNNLQKAQELFIKATAAEPTDPYPWHNWALLKMKRLGNLKSAQAVIDQGLTYVHDSKSRAILLCDRGRILAKRFQYREARQAFEHSLSLDEQNEHTHFFFASDLLVRYGENGNACTHYQRVLALTKDKKRRQTVKDALVRLGCLQGPNLL